jgi:hypothetical protein
MRFYIMLVLGLLLAAPTLAAENNGHNFGGVTCLKPVTCPDSSYGLIDTSSLASNASQCITQFFGFTAADGFFNESLGLDTNNCLTTKPNILPTLASSKTTPRCCIVKLPDNKSCAFHCDLISSQ